MPPRRFCSLIGLAAFTLLLGILFLRNPHGIDPSSPVRAQPPLAARPQTTNPSKNPIDIEPDSQVEENIPSLPTFLHGSLVGTGIPRLKPTITSKKRPPAAQATGAVNGSETVRVTIVESSGSREEVVAALAYAFGSQPNVELSLYLLRNRFGLPELIESFTLSSKQKPKIKSSFEFPKLYDDSSIPHILVSTTCEADLLGLEQSIDAILGHNGTHLFCVVHNGDIWVKDQKLQLQTREWIEQERITFVTLSPHTGKYFVSEAVENWPLRDKVVVRHLVPVYPVPREGTLDDLVENGELAFAIQGDYDAKRRDYASVFSQLAEFLSSPDLDQPKASKISLHVLGHGSAPLVPETIRDHVFFDSDLEYLDYYALLSRTVALLPAFATDDYLYRKASSSIPASLMGGTPLVANQYILDAYTYLPKEVVWFRAENQTDMEVVRSVIQMPAERREKKMEQVRRRCAAIIEENIVAIGQWMDSALHRTGS